MGKTALEEKRIEPNPKREWFSREVNREKRAKEKIKIHFLAPVK
jgi:hypothetical protein